MLVVMLHIAPLQQMISQHPWRSRLFTASFCHSNAVNSFHWLILQLFLFTAKFRDVDAVHSFDAPPKITVKQRKLLVELNAQAEPVSTIMSGPQNFDLESHFQCC